MKHLYQTQKKLFNNSWPKHFSLFLLFLAASMSAFAQTVSTETTVINATQFSVTRPLSEIFAENPVPEDFSIPKAENPDRKKRTPQSFPLAKEGDPVFGNDESSIQKESGEIPSLPVKVNWTGQTGGGGGRPFDPSGAIGPNHYIQMINATIFNVYDKVTGAVLLTGTLGNLWTPAVGNMGDPVVMYDKPANRWFLAQFGSGNKIYIAVSQTANPLGSWYTYTYTSSQFPDYLKFGVWHDAYYMTSNQSTQKVFAFNRSEILAGTVGARSVVVNYAPPIPSGFFCPLPGDAGDGTLPPAGTPCPILSYSDNGWGAGFNDAVNIYNMSVNWVPVVPTATITLAANVATAAFNANYNPSWNDCVQPGTAQKLDGIGGVLMYRSQWKSWPGYNSLVLNWGVEISATQRGIKWCELRQTGGVWSMYQEGIFSPGGDTRWMGSISQNDAGAIGLCYIRSNSTAMFPSLYYSGRRPCDPLGTLPVTETLVAAGTGFQSGTNRVGDYSHMTIDPSNGTTFWATSEYMGGASGFGAARTRIFSFDIAPCVILNASLSISITSGTNPTCGSQNVEFTAFPTNGGAAPSYQWKINGVNVGINSPVFSSATLAAGDIITCVMTSNLPGVTGSPATSNAITMAVNSTPSLGTASISPVNICLGATATISYSPQACETSISFQNEYAPANWILSQTNSNGPVNTTLAPASISMVSSNGLSGAGTTNYSITVPCSGNITFDWNYSTIDGSAFDYPTYSINGITSILFPGYSTSGGSAQSGSATIAVNAGDVFTFQSYSTDNGFGSCTTVISNFVAPVIPDQHFDIFNAPTGGSLLSWSYTGTLDVTPSIAGPITYYAAAHSNISGCYSLSRIPLTIMVHPTPSLGTATISPSSICLGESTTITYTTPTCETIIGFQNVMAPANWTLAQVNSNGTVDASLAPLSISMVSSNGLSGNGQTNYSIPITCTGNVTFDWSYTTVDGSVWDYPTYFINGGAPILFPGYSTSGGSVQSGTASIAVNSGDVLTLQAHSVDNSGGPCTTVISNFNAPSAPNQHFDVYNAATGGTLLTWSYTGSAIMTPTFVGNNNYYVAAHSDSAPFCYSQTRIPLNVVVKPLPLLGTASVAPTPICLGESTTLTYSPVLCATNIGFQNTYAPANWALAQLNSNGSVNTAGAPGSISMVSSNGLSGAGQTNYSITIPCSGNITFDWSYSTIDAAIYDYPQYVINSGGPVLFPGYDLFGATTQNGTVTIAVNAGDVFTFQAYSSDNFGGSCVIDISNFVAPASTPFQFVSWYDAATGGNYIGGGNTLNYLPTSAGSFTYYAEVADFSCLNPTRVATNSLTVNAVPNVVASASPNPICTGASTTINAIGAATYVWNPGALSGGSVVVTPANTTIYTVIGTASNGCTNSSFVNVFVNPAPILGTATATPATFCLGGNTSLAYTAPAGPQCNGAYQSGFAGIYAPINWTLTQLNSNGSVNTSGAPANISMVSSNGMVGSSQTNYTITIPCSGIVSFNWSYTTPDGPFYDNPRYSINGGPFILFPGFSSFGGNTQNGTFNVLVNAGETLTLQAYSSDNFAGGCTTVISNFSAPYQTLSTQSVTWFNAPTGGTNLGSGNPLIHTPIISGTFGTYAQVTNTTTGCVNSIRAASNAITINPLPIANAGVDKVLTCTTPSTTIGTAAIIGNSYAWSPAIGLSATNIAVPTCTALVNTNYTVTVTTANGCIATDVVVVTVNKTAPVANAGVDKTLTCTTPSSTIGTAAIAGNTYAWSPATGLSATNIAVPTCIALVNTNYTVTVIGANGCTATDVVVVTVNKTAPTADAGVDKTLTCTTPSSTIGTAAIPGNTYAWSPAAGLSATNIAVPTSTALVNTNYTVTVTGANGCTATDVVVVTVNKTAPIADAGLDKTLTCTTPSSTIGTAAIAGNTYAWSPATGLSATNIAVPTSTALVNTNYTVTVTGANGCTATDVVVVTINKTAPVADAGLDKTLTCTTPSSTIGTAAIAGNTYAWSPATGLSATNIAVPTSTALVNTNYTVTVTGTNGCTATDVVVVTINKTAPVADAGLDKILTCSTPSSTIGTAAIAGNTYAWSPATGLSATNIAVPTSTALVSTNYTVTVTGANGCTATDVVVVTVNKTAPTANAGVDKTLTCTTPSSTIGTAAIAGNTYAWSPATGLNATNIAVPTSTALVNTNYTVTVTGANGCTATDVVVVTVNKTLPTVGTTATSVSIPCGGSTSITGTGAVSYTWMPGALSGTTITVSPLVTTIYTVTGTGANGCTNTATRTITVAPCGGSTLNLKLYIQGYYLGAGLMDNVMQNQFIAGATSTQTDTITVELRNTSFPFGIAATVKTMLNTNGTAVCNFPITGTYYIAVKHRNALQTWSANPIILSAAPVTYDFSNLITKAYGSNQISVSAGVFAFYSGDVVIDENIDLLDQGLQDLDISNFESGYFATDINGDGNVDLLDSPILDANINAFVFSAHP